MKQGNNKNRNRGHNRNSNNNGYNNNNNNNNNQNRTRPNVPSKNHVLESSGPSGKIRGNTMQLIEKYLSAGKDAVSQDDLVLAENCYQYADHYTRLLNLANAYDNNRREEQQRHQNNAPRIGENDEGKTDNSDNSDNQEVVNNNVQIEKTEEVPLENLSQVANIPFLNKEIIIKSDNEEVSEEKEVRKRKPYRGRKKVETVEETATDVSV